MLLEARGVESGYGKVTILHGIDLAIRAGEIVVVLGPNGAGKSTLLKTIAGHLPVTRGEILFDGERIDSKLSAAEISKAGVGFVPQEQNIFGRLSVIENLRVSALSRPDVMAEAVESSLERFPILRDRAAQKASTLSGGERQILAISSAIMLAPRLILLDEPTSGLSPAFIDTIVDWIVSLVEGASTGVIWVVEQNPEPILAVSSRTYMLEAGQVSKEVPSAELLADGRLRQVLLEDRTTEAAANAVEEGHPQAAPGSREGGNKGVRGAEAATRRREEE
jgi:branched-chain amino acid transport system ATP-binding protein